MRTIIALKQAFNQRDLPGMLRLDSDACVLEHSSSPQDGAGYQGKPAISQFWQDYFNQYPLAHLKIEETIGFGLRCFLAGGVSIHMRPAQPHSEVSTSKAFETT